MPALPVPTTSQWTNRPTNDARLTVPGLTACRIRADWTGWRRGGHVRVSRRTRHRTRPGRSPAKPRRQPLRSGRNGDIGRADRTRTARHGISRRRPPPAAGSDRRSNTTTSSSTRPPPSLVFPQIFFPSGNPTVAIVASLATYGVGYVARPIGAFVLGHWGDTHGRKNVLILCMFLMGFSTMAVGLLPTYRQVGLLAPALLVAAAPDPGLRRRRRDLRRQLDDPRARAVRPPRLLRQLHPAGRAGRADPRGGRLPAARALSCPTRRSMPGAGASRSCSASS